MNGPLQDVNDSQDHRYRPQLNPYQWMLGKYCHVNEFGRHSIKVVRIHPWYLPDGFVHDVPDLENRIEGTKSWLRVCNMNFMSLHSNPRLLDQVLHSHFM